MYDVLVVGAGPTGSYIAGRLAALGHRVIVFEKHSRVGEAVCCTGILGRECIEQFPVDGGVILREANSAKVFAPSGAPLHLQKDKVQAYITDRPAFDSLMARKAQEEGAEYLFGRLVKDVRPEKNLVRIEAENRGKISNLEAKTVVVASGFSFDLTQKLGLGRLDDFVVGAQAEVDADGIGEPEIYLGNQIAPGFFAWLVPTSGGRALVGLLSRHRSGLYLRNLLSTLSRQGKIATPQAKISYGGIPLKPLSRTYRKRVLAVGDAAGQVKPTTGGGIYYGLLSAQIAVDTLHKALGNNDFSARTFSAYERGWKRKLSRELRTDYFARRLFERLSDENIERIFQIVQSNGIHESLLKSDDLSFDWHRGIIKRALKHLALRRAVRLLSSRPQ